jgi:4'-phosphopantetheinyl transferase
MVREAISQVEESISVRALDAGIVAGRMARSQNAVTLGSGEVQVWFARLDRMPARLARMRTVLNPDEAARADRFFMDVHRNRFIAARALLRDLLAGYLDQAPASIRFAYNEWGKPALAEGFGGRDVRFNLSHSQDLAIYAFALECAVGVDVEIIRRDFAIERLAENFFSTSEVATLRALKGEHQRRAFFNCWTRKEAYVKARGQGLSIELKSFDVSVRPGEPAEIICGVGRAGWSMYSFEPAPDCVSALVVEGRELHVADPRWL